MTVEVAPVPFLDLAGTHAVAADELEFAWTAVRAHGAYVGGPEVARFEREFAAYCGATSCVGVANGTDALELILADLGVGAGDEVLVPANTFVATAEAVCAVGAVPRFIDVRPDTLLLDVDAAKAAVTPRTVAVIAVHLFGQMADVDALERLARQHSLALVEDAAQAHGATFAGRRAGSVGVAAAFSFYPGKNLGALGDGGAVVTDDGALAERIRVRASHGRSPVDRHRHVLSGRNSRLDTLQAAFLSVRLARLDGENLRRARAAAHYREQLAGTCRIVEQDPRASSVYHLLVVQVDDRIALTRALDAARIGWGVHYPVPCHRQPAFAAFGGDCPVADDVAGRILSLPLSPTITRSEVDRVCEVVREVVR